MGFPSGVAAGRGRAAAYDSESIMQMVFAFELVQCGLNPSTIVSIVKMNWDIMLPAIVRAATPNQLVSPGRFVWPDAKIFFCVRPEALYELTDRSVDDAEYRGSVEVLHLNDLQDRLYNSEAPTQVGSFARSIVLNVPFRVLSCLVVLKAIDPAMEYSGVVADLETALALYDLDPEA